MGILGFIGIIALSIFQLTAGFSGIEYHFGELWAFIAIGLALLFRITLPITIACFFGATDVWGWHWAWALALTLPGFVFFIPGFIMSAFESIKSK